ncbi:MAG: DUF4406 domain-containing protein [Candidatus Shapirobacteria bacterium]|jgi:hypothetical protein
MKDKIKKITPQASTLDELALLLKKLFSDMWDEGITQIGYVSGIITAEGPENIPKNILRLEKFTAEIRGKSSFPIFSATDIFDDDLFARLSLTGAKNADYEVFWRQILGSGFVTHMYMTPRWEISHGACDEHQVAKNLNMEIVYIFDEI